MLQSDENTTQWKRLGGISMRLIESALVAFSLLWLFGFIH